MEKTDDIKRLLTRGVVKFTFIKTDGTVRTAYGTLFPSVVAGVSKTRKYKPAPKGNVTYFDLEKDDWRQFRMDSLKEILAVAEAAPSTTHGQAMLDYKALLGESPSGTDPKTDDGATTSESEDNARTKAQPSILERLIEKFPVPTIWNGGFYVNDKVWTGILTNIHQRINTLMVGPAGTGKTELVRYAASKMGLPYRHYNIGSMTDVQASLIGSHTIDAYGHSMFSYSQFVYDIQQPGIVMLDELNRNPQALNVLTNVLDGIRELNVSGTGSADSLLVKVHPGCIFFATANIGATYTGTSMIDEALETRFDFIGVDYLPEQNEIELLMKRTGCAMEIASCIAKVARNIRELYAKDELSKSLSTRETIRIAQKASIGNSLKDAFSGTLCRFEGTDSDGERGIVYKVILSA